MLQLIIKCIIILYRQFVESIFGNFFDDYYYYYLTTVYTFLMINNTMQEFKNFNLILINWHFICYSNFGLLQTPILSMESCVCIIMNNNFLHIIIMTNTTKDYHKKLYYMLIISLINKLLSNLENLSSSIFAPDFIISRKCFPAFSFIHHFSPNLFCR